MSPKIKATLFAQSTSNGEKCIKTAEKYMALHIWSFGQ